jgi:phosphate transport system permease protein
MAQPPVPLDKRPGGAAADFDRPLLLSMRENLSGWLFSHIGRAILLAITASSILAVLLIFIFIIRGAFDFFVDPAAMPAVGGDSIGAWIQSAFSWLLAAVAAAAGRIAELLGSTHWYPKHEPAPEFGALAIVVGSLYVSLGALFVAVPIGLLASMCLSDILPFSIKQIAKPVIEVLAAIPSVAFGCFAVLVLAPLMQTWLGMSTGCNALNCALILAVMAIPTIVSVSEDSLSAVGRELREASYACGATRAETLLKVVMPAAHSGILAAIVLGMMRAIGETMVVWMASGNAAHIPSPWWDLTQSIRTLTGTIAGEMGEAVHGDIQYRSLFALGLLLLVFTFGLNLVTEHFLRRVRHAGGAGR